MIFKNTFKSTIRHLLRDKIYLLVSVLSLSAGLICCLFIFKYVQDEWSYDRFHEDADRIFRIEYEAMMEDGFINRYANLHGDVLPDWLHSVSEIELRTRFTRHPDLYVEVSGELFEERNVLAADSSFFRLFSFSLIEGLPASVLAAPNSVVISETTARKYFDISDAVGKVLAVQSRDNEVLLTVTGVMEDVPPNSHFSFDMVTSARAYEELYGWGLDEIQQAYSYIRLTDGVSVDLLERRLNEIHNRNRPQSPISYFLRALTDIHLHSSARGELAPNGNITYIYLFSLIALIILTIACVNFTTLATARSVKRTNEIGIRKVYGAGRGDLISVYLLEGVLLALCGLVAALFFAWQFLPLFNNLAGKTITVSQLIEPSFLLIMIVMTVLTGCLTAFYPALVTTKTGPVSLLFKNPAMSLRGGEFWKGVITAQFTTTIVLILASYVVHQQVRFIQNKDLGFDKEQILTFPNYFGQNAEPFLDRVGQHPDIEQVTVSSYVPGVSKSSGTAEVRVEGKADAVTFDWISVDPHYLDTYGITLTEGRNFSAERPADATEAFIINEAAVKALGFDQPLGKQMNAFDRDGQVIGVVEDFHFLSLHSEIAPLVLTIYDQLYFTISAKIRSTDQLSVTISDIEVIWRDLLPGTPFTYEFADNRFAAVYEFEQKTRSMFLVFSGLAMIIAVLGLFSFASFSMQQKTREIGIRKVLGASVYDILKYFYNRYFRLLIIATVLALPVGMLWMRNWLQNFSYRVDIGLDMLAIPFMISVAIILLSVSFQVVKEALRNPAETIRAE